MRALLLSLLAASACCPPEPGPAVVKAPPPPAAPDTKDLALPGEGHLTHLRQLTFGADNAEAYWSFGGDKLIFQTNHKPYECDQIEEMPVSRTASPTAMPGKLVSTGKGRTTCSFFLKGDQEIIYASTHEKSAACPTPPDMSKGYYWGLFDYDIYRANADGSSPRKLTDSPGYDAEATVCAKDGSILFTSERSGDLELWRMNADGSGLRQLTDLPGYDGGAFFSPDCSKIVWRTSRPTGKDLEDYKALLAQHLVKPTKMDIWVANADGTDARRLTYLPGASFAPFFYPDGKRIMFSSNYLSPRGPEFDLFGIDLDGSHLERITTGPSFDGFPMFSPDGQTLSFSSNRRDTVKGPDGKEVYRVTGTPAGEHDTNVFLADWAPGGAVTYQPETAPVDRYAANVAYLADDAREGRGIGTKGLADAADHVQAQLAALGVEPGAGSGWRQPFEMVTEIRRADATGVVIDGAAVDAKELAPMVYSANKEVHGAVVAAGWGIVDKDAKLDDYQGVPSVKGKLVLVHRFVPASAKLDAAMARNLGDVRRKAFTAKQKGAIGLIVVDDGELTVDEAALPELRPGGISDAGAGAQTDAGIPIVVLSRKGAAPLLAKAETGAKAKAHEVKVTVALQPVPVKTENVIGVIRAGAATKQPGVIVLGAHLDHLGMGGPDALDPGVHAVHNGADDNASGVAALIEAAAELSAKKGELQRDVYIMAFSGEEEGLIGSEYFLKHPTFGDKVAAMINMDMVGRMRNNQLHVNGADSAPEWKAIVQAACDAATVVCSIGGSGYGPSDQMAFYVAGAPVLFLFTGSHTDYHTATDDADRINAAGGVRAAMVAASSAFAAANHVGPLTYVKAPPEPMGGGDGPRRASLGTVPSYDEDPNRPPGMVLSDVIPEGPAAKAGLQKGDRIVKLDDTEIRSVNDLMFVLQTSKPGTTVKVTFVRGGATQTVTATYGAPRQRH